MTEALDVTGLLNAWCGGNPEALDRLVPLLYDELRRVALRVIMASGAILDEQAIVNARWKS